VKLRDAMVKLRDAMVDLHGAVVAGTIKRRNGPCQGARA